MFICYCSVSSEPIRAQATFEACQALYQTIIDNRVSPDLEKLKLARSSANEYLVKCSELPEQDKIKTYVSNQIPKIEERIKLAEIKLVEERYNKAIKDKNYEDMVSTAKELLKMNRPYSLDLMLDIASIGFDNASAKPAVEKYNDAAITFAMKALEEMSQGKTSGNVDTNTGKADRYGVYVPYKTKECSDGKANATGWMNYTIGFITYNSLKQKKDALPHLFKASQVGCETRANSELYRMIGAWYLEEFIRLDAVRMEKIKAAGNQDTKESLELLALEKGYADRALDAYARAYKAASENKTASQAYKDSLLTKLKEVYGVRFDDDMSKFDLYMTQTGVTAFPDPTTAVTPILAATESTTESKSATAPSQK